MFAGPLAGVAGGNVAGDAFERERASRHLFKTIKSRHPACFEYKKIELTNKK